MRRLADLLLTTLVAPPCAVCGRVLVRPLAGAVCDACWHDIRSIVPPICDACGAPVPSRQLAAAYGGRCPACAGSRSAIDRARALGEYAGTLRSIVHALKYDGRRSVAPRLAAMMRAAGSEVLRGADGLVPVPLHPRRRRTRGFNQAALLARAIGVPVWDVLIRTRHTKPQVDLPADARRVNVADVFAVRGTGHTIAGAWGRLLAARSSRDRESLRGAVLVLIDDVMTTGATLEACAQALKHAGAGEVRALTAARVESGPPHGSPR